MWRAVPTRWRLLPATLAAAILLVIGGQQVRSGALGTSSSTFIRLAQASSDDEAWKALEVEQDRRRRARQQPATPDPIPTTKLDPAPRSERTRPVLRIDRPAARAGPAIQAPRENAASRREQTRAVAPEQRSRAPARLAEPAPRARPSQGGKTAECYRAVGIPTDAAGRPLRDVATAGERSQEAFIRCVDGR